MSSSKSIASSKTRSPNYPSIGLEEAIGRVKLIYDSQGRHPTTRAVMARLMGYSSLNGASVSTVSALAKYGLIEGHGENLRVSEIGQDVVLHRKGDTEYSSALRNAAAMPAFFRELRDQYPDGLPSEHALKAALIKRGFNPSAIDGALRAYRDTVAFVETEAGALEQASSPSFEPDPVQFQPSTSLASRGAVRGTHPSTVVILSPSLSAEILFRGGYPTAHDIELLQRYLAISAEALARPDPTLDSDAPGSIGEPDQSTQ